MTTDAPNAVILAAGFSSRFAPISYEKPKGLLKVRGEVLIERQIEQLRAAGIEDISIVVGYKKEYFFYLEDKYGVRIIINDEYASRNNHSSIMAARKYLKNTFVCSSDNYFEENPFESQVEGGAYYAVQYVEGETDEWCVKTADDATIKSLSVGGANAWCLIGHAYFDEMFSKKLLEYIENEYHLPETADKLWEHFYMEHIDELAMKARRYDPSVIREFDSLDEVREFDPLFLENVDTDIFDNISKVLSCPHSQMRDVYPLKQGLTNLSCHIATDSGEYVYRHPGVGTENMIDRHAETRAQEVAREMGLDGTFIYEDPEKGWKLSRFLVDCHTLDVHDDAGLAQAMEMAGRLHTSDAVLDRRFDFFDEGKRYEALLRAMCGIDVAGYDEMANSAERLKAYVDADGADICLTHNDFFPLNMLVDAEGSCHLIDWEYAGMGDYANDFGTFCVCSQLSEEEVERALFHYFGRRPSEEERRHNLAYIGLAGWCWYAWSLLKEAQGDFVGEWLYIYYEYAKKYLAKALALYEG